MSRPQILLTSLPNIPLVRPGDDLVALIWQGLSDGEIRLQAGDIVVVASKIVSKSEGRQVYLGSVEVSDQAIELAARTGKDAREIELMLRESSEVVRARRGLIITRHKLGFVCANAGVDHSNVSGEGDCVLLLPEDPDGSAEKIRQGLEAASGSSIGVIVADSHGRPHRLGTVGTAIGVAGLPALEDWRGRKDLFGYVLQHTEVGLADMIASAATLLLGQAREGTPVVHVRGVPHSAGGGAARDLIRSKDMDLFQ